MCWKNWVRNSLASCCTTTFTGLPSKSLKAMQNGRGLYDCFSLSCRFANMRCSWNTTFSSSACALDASVEEP